MPSAMRILKSNEQLNPKNHSQTFVDEPWYPDFILYPQIVYDIPRVSPLRLVYSLLLEDFRIYMNTLDGDGSKAIAEFSGCFHAQPCYFHLIFHTYCPYWISH